MVGTRVLLPGKEIRVMEFTCTISVKSCNYVIYNRWPHCRCLAGRRIRIKRKPELFLQYIYWRKSSGFPFPEYFNTKNAYDESFSNNCSKKALRSTLSLSISEEALCKRELLSIELESFTWRLTTTYIFQI